MGNNPSVAEARELSACTRLPNVDEIAKRVGSSVGNIQCSGRIHRHPRTVDDDYTLSGTVLGTGANGDVRLAHRRGASDGMRFAVKPLSLERRTQRDRLELESELEISLTIDHPHIVRLVDVYIADQYVYLVMECLDGGEVFDRLAEKKAFSEQEAAETVDQMLLAVNYLHSIGFAHCDLKLENFLYDTKGGNHVKLIDFGYSKRAVKGMSERVGTAGYVAPEVLGESYTSQCDLWSLGVICFMLLSGYQPFSGRGDMLFNAIKAGRYQWKSEKWAHVSAEGQSFMKSLLTVDPSRRLSAPQAMQHPWIAQRKIRHSDKEMDVDVSTAKALQAFGKVSKFRRICLSMVAWSMTNEERAKVRGDFLKIDKSKTGTISSEELKQMLIEKLGAIDDSELRNIFDNLSTHQDGHIHYTDFLAAMVSTKIELHEDLLRRAFARFDTDGSGRLTVATLRSLAGDRFEGVEVAELVSEAGFSEDGVLTFPGFCTYLRGDEMISSHQELANVRRPAITRIGRQAMDSGDDLFLMFGRALRVICSEALSRAEPRGPWYFC